MCCEIWCGQAQTSNINIEQLIPPSIIKHNRTIKCAKTSDKLKKNSQLNTSIQGKFISENSSDTSNTSNDTSVTICAICWLPTIAFLVAGILGCELPLYTKS